jgi:hypothetical protein
MANPTDMIASEMPIPEKNPSGRSERYSLMMVLRMRTPSRQVLSLECDPSGRA